MDIHDFMFGLSDYEINFATGEIGQVIADDAEGDLYQKMECPDGTVLSVNYAGGGLCIEDFIIPKVGRASVYYKPLKQGLRHVEALQVYADMTRQKVTLSSVYEWVNGQKKLLPVQKYQVGNQKPTYLLSNADAKSEDHSFQDITQQQPTLHVRSGNLKLQVTGNDSELTLMGQKQPHYLGIYRQPYRGQTGVLMRYDAYSNNMTEMVFSSGHAPARQGPQEFRPITI